MLALSLRTSLWNICSADDNFFLDFFLFRKYLKVSEEVRWECRFTSISARTASNDLTVFSRAGMTSRTLSAVAVVAERFDEYFPHSGWEQIKTLPDPLAIVVARVQRVLAAPVVRD